MQISIANSDLNEHDRGHKMKVKELLRHLTNADPESTIWLEHNGTDSFDFSGINTDDASDIILYIVAGDQEA